MNTHTADTLIRCYRPGKPADSRTQKAVKFAEQDPELCKKLSEQIQFDSEIVDVIHCIHPPDDLRAKLSDSGARPEEKTRLRRQVVNPAILTALMGVLLLVGVIVFMVMERLEKFPGREHVEGLLGTAAKMTGVELEPLTTTAGQMGDWLIMRNYEGYEAPPELAALPVVGWRVFRYDGRTVAQIAVDKHDSLLYEFRASEFGVQLPPDGDWLVMDREQWVGAIRQRGDLCFLIAFRGTKAEMRDFLRSLPAKK